MKVGGVTRKTKRLSTENGPKLPKMVGLSEWKQETEAQNELRQHVVQ